MPLIAFGLISSTLGLRLRHGENSGALAVTGAFALLLLAACAVILDKEFAAN